jgi:polysaccharide deacetylase family protein (PEP-CTERM system associated)
MMRAAERDQSRPAGSSRPGKARRTLLVSFDLEDCDQLLARRFGNPAWDRRWVGFERQLGRVLELLDSLRAKATFFVLGMTARNHGDWVQELASRGHDIAAHGFDHEPVFDQSRDDFRRDVERSLELITSLTGQHAVGYRAPAFSMGRDVAWAFEVLADLGVRYDSSLYDSPRHRRRLGGIPEAPCRIELGSGRSLWEFPLAVVRFGRVRIPVGGGSYWRVLPVPVLRASLEHGTASDLLPLYFHPYECDDRPLNLPLAQPPTRSQRLLAASYWLRAKPGWGTLPERLRSIARDFDLATYASALEHLEDEDDGSGARSLSAGGVIV